MGKLVVFYDTETTGIPEYKLPSDSPNQPHIVQLAAALVDLNEKKIISSMDVIIKPDGWDIPDAVAEIHGITTAIAIERGVDAELAIKMFHALATDENGNVRMMIAHNESFDARIVRIGMKRTGFDDETLEAYKNREKFCTMQSTKKIVNAAPTEKMIRAGFNTAKNPRLEESYKYFTGKDITNAHNAMVDVKACMTVYFALKELGNEG